MISFRTLYVDRRKTTPSMALSGSDSLTHLLNNKKNSFGESFDSKLDTSLMLMVWQQKLKNSDSIRIHVDNFKKTNFFFSSFLFIYFFFKGSLFDLNSFYLKRLSSRVLPDNTIAKQYPFFSRFISDLQPTGTLLLVCFLKLFLYTQKFFIYLLIYRTL